MEMSSAPDSRPVARSRKSSALLTPPGTSPDAHMLKAGQLRPSFPLVAFLWSAKGGTSPWVLIPIILMVAGLFRWSAGLWDYSGYQSPPMHGDFEAQRHWMEITTHLPLTSWYFHDLLWWGLDYPPLTAYHSWLFGKIGSRIQAEWFSLYTSRSLDDPNLKIYMRASVLISEYAIFVPAVIVFCRRLSLQQNVNTWEMCTAMTAILLQPATILIDHAHFQYNTVMLGFVVASLSSMLVGNYKRSSFFFVAALGFKQMALYYAPAIFACLLGRSITPSFNAPRLAGIAIVTAASFAALFAPLVLAACFDVYKGIPTSQVELPPMIGHLRLDRNEWYFAPLLQIAQCIHRVLPFARGLFEDKVANFWCALHVFHKLNVYSSATLQRLSLLSTVMAITPPCILLGAFKSHNLLLYGFAATAWGFFLFSFQVHEKSILIPLLPMTLLLSGRDGLLPWTRSWVAWANILGTWTLFPLLRRDGLAVPYFVLVGLWVWLMGVWPMLIEKPLGSRKSLRLQQFSRGLHGVFYGLMVFWHVLEMFVVPPAGKPDLWVVLNVLVGAIGSCLCYLWCLLSMLQCVGWRNFFRLELFRNRQKEKTG